MTKILYVEDNEDNVYMLKMRLELIEGFEIAVAYARMPFAGLMRHQAKWLHEAARFHESDGRLNSRLVARRTHAEADSAGDRISRQPIARRFH